MSRLHFECSSALTARAALPAACARFFLLALLLLCCGRLAQAQTNNFRSIGTNAANLHPSGTASVALGSTTVTFSAALPVATATGAIGLGDKLTIEGEVLFVLARDSNFLVTLQSPATVDHSTPTATFTVIRAYNTLQAWEDDCAAVPGCLPTSGGGRGGDLVADNRYETGVAYNDAGSGAFIDNDVNGSVVQIAGSTVDATRHRELTVAVGQRHNATAGTGAVVDGQASTVFPIEVGESNTRIAWLEIKNGNEAGNGASVSVFVGDGASNVTNVLLEYLLVYDYAAGNFSAGAKPNPGGGSDSFTVRNSIFYNGGIGVRSSQAGDSVTVENCTSYNMDWKGYEVSLGGAMSVTNSIAAVTLTGDFAAGITGDYNLDADGSTAPGANSLHGRLASNQFVSIAVGSEDLHLKAGADALGAGLDLSGSFCCDIDGAARPIGAAWDIGADELAAGPSLTLADHDAGQVSDQFATTTPVTSELFGFKLSTTGTVTVDNIRVRFTTSGGVVNGDVAGGELHRDNNNNGVIDAGDTPIQTGVAAAGGVLAFTSLGEIPGPGANYLVRATVSNLVAGDVTIFSLGTADVDELVGGVSESGSTSIVIHTQDSVSGGDVYYSVGASRATSTDLKTGGPTISITNGTATLSAAQTGDVGVGDEINYGAGSLAYIKAVHSQTEFAVHTANGGVPPDVSGNIVNSIMRAFDTPANANTNSGTASYLGNFDLRATGADANLTWVAYNDAPFTAGLTLDGYSANATRFVTLTAAGASQVASGNSQRHTGVAGTGVVIDGGGTPIGRVVLQDRFTRFEWFEVRNVKGALGGSAHVVDVFSNDVLITHLILHDFKDPANPSNDGLSIHNSAFNASYTVRNSLIYDGQSSCIQGDGSDDTVTIENTTVYDCAQGIRSAPGGSPINVTNTISMGSTLDFDMNVAAAWSNNVSQDATAPGAGSFQVLDETTMFVNVTPGDEANWDFHLISGAGAIDMALDLSGSFTIDIDAALRAAPWDIGADDFAATTEVELVSFVASGTDGAVVLEWETATELNNVGFHLYRSPSAAGPFERITSQVIPGLGSSPAGATYRHVDGNLANGQTNYYELEDIETTGRTKRYGPVSATSAAGVTTTESASTRISYGEPEANELRIVKRTDRVVVLELVTRGFYAEPLDDGTVEVTVPNYLESEEASVPVKRLWLDLPFDRDVKRVRVVEREVERFSGLTPAGLSAELVAERDGTVRATRRRRRARQTLPARAARIVSQGFQGSEHKALLELAPLRWSQELVLSQRLVVRVVLGKRKMARARAQGRASVRLVTKERGLYAVRHRRRQVRLSRQGETVPYHREGATLYFLGEKDAVYELSKKPGAVMDVVDGAPVGPVLPYYWHTERLEENRYYQAALVDAPDIWLWDYLLAPMEKSFSFEVTGLASSEPATLHVWLQGASDLAHQVRFLVNGTFVGVASWDGKRDHLFEAETLLQEGANELTLESVGDTYSMVMLDRFEVVYPRFSVGELEGAWRTGTAEVSALDAAYVLDVGGETPRWVRGLDSGENRVRFRTEEGNRYLVASHAMAPETRRVRRSNLLKKTRRAQWILIAPAAFLDEARPLVQLRQAQGLRARAVSLESIYDEFGYGEPRPEAIRNFLRAVYHKTGSLKYVVLLGDGTFDFEDYLGTGVKNQVPPMMVKTSYLWTASDPAYAAVNGDDLLPDIAIGRLPAASVVEARTMVQKILAYEQGETSLLDGPVVLVADNPDRAGDFVADADALAATLLSDKMTTKLYLPGTTRQDVIQAFDDGASLVSYLGHGAIHLWADENIFNSNDVVSLSKQSRQPLLLTMNCLNGYFHFPYFDSLAESLLKAEDKGVIAAFSPSGLSLNEPAKLYQEALVDELFHGGHQRLGDAVLEAQKRYADTGAFPELLAIYHLFGDPALTLR